MALIKNIKDKIESKEEAARIEKIIKETATEISKEIDRERPVEKGWEMGKKEKQPEEALSQEGELKGQEMAGFAVSPVVQQARKEREKRIEKILEDNMEEIYLKLSPEKQKEFRVMGEQTARQINAILEKTKFKIKEIINLIRKWLSLIPGVNKFFLEQEAKIKADKIVSLKK